MNHNKLILPLLLVAVVVSLGFGTSYAQTDEAELVDQINRLNDRLLELQATQANIENKIDKFETKRDNVQAGLDRLQERGGSEEKIEKRIAKLTNIDKNIAKLEANKIKNQEKIDNVESKITAKESQLAELRSSATQPDRSGRGDAPRGLVENDSTPDGDATGANDDAPAQITEFRAIFTPHGAINASPQAGASWIEPDDDTITEYKLDHQLLNEGEWTEVRLLHGNNSYYIDAEYDSTYSFRISAINDNGQGPVSAIQNVTVVDFSTNDTVAPVFSGDSDITHSGIIPFNYTKPIATDDINGDVKVTCNSDKVFNFGENEIFCHAYDHDGNLAETSFTVTLLPLLEPIDDCTINVPVGGLVREFHPSECDDQYDGVKLADISRSMLYGKAVLNQTTNIIEITGPEMSPDLTSPGPLTLRVLNHIADEKGIDLDELSEFGDLVPRDAKSESFGITLDKQYGPDRPVIDIDVKYVPMPDIMIQGDFDEIITHELPTPGIPTDYEFVQVERSGHLRNAGVTVTGTESDGIITLNFTLPSTSELSTITGNLFVTYAVTTIETIKTDTTVDPRICVSCPSTMPTEETVTTEETITTVENIRFKVPVTIDFPLDNESPSRPTFSPITLSGTSATSVTHELEVSGVPEDYEFVSAKSSNALGSNDLTVVGVESNGIITLTFNLPSVDEETTRTGDVIVKYTDGNGDRQKFRVHATITVFAE